MTTINPMNQLPLSDNANRLEHNVLSGLRIPLGKEVQQIALTFASEQATVAKGKQVFLNTLSVIAVHKCLKWFGIESYLDCEDCWNKTRRATFNVADLLVEDWGRLECFPILPEQSFIDLSPGLLENRRGLVAVKFHQHLNFVEMFGFKLLDEVTKSQLEEDLELNIEGFQGFENIFNYIKPCPTSSISNWKTFRELGRPERIFAGSLNKSNKGVVIPLGTEKIILGAIIEKIDSETQNIVFKIYNYLKDSKLPDTLTITIFNEMGVVDGYKQRLIENIFSFEMKIKNLLVGTKFTLVFSCNNIQRVNKFIIE